MLPQLRQYLSFCTSKASKLSTRVLPLAAEMDAYAYTTNV